LIESLLKGGRDRAPLLWAKAACLLAKREWKESIRLVEDQLDDPSIRGGVLWNATCAYFRLSEYRSALNTISTILPVGLAISTIKKGATGVHANVGQASIEAELMDSQTNERLGAAIDTKVAEKYKLIEGMSKWGHVKDAFKFWANRLRIVLDEAHGKKT